MQNKESKEAANRKDDAVRKIYRKDINNGYFILYLSVFIIIVVGEIILYRLEDNFSIAELFRDLIGNLMGVMAAFLIFDIAHEKMSKDAYASEVSEQILDTLMYHPETMELYENDQKKTFVNAFIGSIVEDQDVSEMISSHLNTYLLTAKDFQNNPEVTEKDCRIKTAFSYRFVLEEDRKAAFGDLKAPVVDGRDPYFYVQEELLYIIKYLNPKGNYTDSHVLKMGFIYDNEKLDRFLRGNKSQQNNLVLRNCIFRENLDIEEEDKKLFQDMAGDKEALISLVKKMIRPHLKIDNMSGKLTDVEVIGNSGVIISFTIDHDLEAMEHDISLVFHMPKKWNGILEVALVEPTKNPHISLSYNEDMMDVEMYSFLNKGESSAYENASENENGVYSISISDEWVFPISGVVFPVKRRE